MRPQVLMAYRGTNERSQCLNIAPFKDDFMLAANDNTQARNLQIAIWKMLRAGLPTDLILSTLGITEHDLGKYRANRTD